MLPEKTQYSWNILKYSNYWTGTRFEKIMLRRCGWLWQYHGVTFTGLYATSKHWGIRNKCKRQSSTSAISITWTGHKIYLFRGETLISSLSSARRWWATMVQRIIFMRMHGGCGCCVVWITFQDPKAVDAWVECMHQRRSLARWTIPCVCALLAPCCCCALAWKQESKLLLCVKVVIVRVLCVW